MKETIDNLFVSQLEKWTLAGRNYAALRQVKLKEIEVDNAKLSIQFNPGRIVSSSAKVDKESLAARPCFLCQENLPKEQEGVMLLPQFLLLVNPFPILRKHFTIVNTLHTPQRLLPYLADLLQITQKLGEAYTVFYNGPKCGASAPDHMHFQAGLTKQFPIWNFVGSNSTALLYEKDNVRIKVFESYVNAIVIEADTEKRLVIILEQILAFFATLQPNEEEPLLNLLARYDKTWQVVLFPRDKHRPWQYFAEDDTQILLSPASVDFGGLLAVPREKDFERIDADLLGDIFSQLRLNTKDFESLKSKIRKL